MPPVPPRLSRRLPWLPPPGASMEPGRVALHAWVVAILAILLWVLLS